MKRLFSFALTLTLIALFALPELGLAQSLADQISGQIQAGAGAAEIGSAKPPQQIIAEFIQIILSVLGVFFMGLTVFGGYMLFTARGETDRVQKSQSIIRGAVIGLFIILSAYGITRFVVSRIQHSVSGNPAMAPQGSGIRVNCQGNPLDRNCTVEGL